MLRTFILASFGDVLPRGSQRDTGGVQGAPRRGEGPEVWVAGVTCPPAGSLNENRTIANESVGFATEQ